MAVSNLSFVILLLKNLIYKLGMCNVIPPMSSLHSQLKSREYAHVTMIPSEKPLGVHIYRHQLLFQSIFL